MRMRRCAAGRTRTGREGGLVMLWVKLEDAADDNDAAAADDDECFSAADDVDHLHVSVPRSPHERRQSVSAAAS